MELLRPQDAFFWHVETPSVPEHVAGLAILDPSTAPGGSMTADDLIRLVERRLPRVPQLSRRIVVPWLGLDRGTLARGSASCPVGHRAVRR